MSLSDTDDNQFKPMDLSSLETFDQEQVSKTPETEPDFGRFKLLFEMPKFEEQEPYQFEAFCHGTGEKEKIVFKPLIEPKTKPIQNETADQDRDGLEKHPASETQEAEVPKETPEETGFRQGFEKGLHQGIEQGQKQGFEQGFETGQTQGFEKGEPLGFEKGLQQGSEQGFKEGQEKATLETRQTALEILSSLEELLKAADQTLELLVDTYEPRIISLIQQIAEKAVMAQLEIKDEIVRHMILEALKTLVKPEEVTLSISPEDYEYIEMIKDEFFEQIDSLEKMAVRSDPSIKRGGCKIDTLTASVSADPEARLKAIFEAVKKAGTA